MFTSSCHPPSFCHDNLFICDVWGDMSANEGHSCHGHTAHSPLTTTSEGGCPAPPHSSLPCWYVFCAQELAICWQPVPLCVCWAHARGRGDSSLSLYTTFPLIQPLMKPGTATSCTAHPFIPGSEGGGGGAHHPDPQRGGPPTHDFSGICHWSPLLDEAGLFISSVMTAELSGRGPN